MITFGVVHSEARLLMMSIILMVIMLYIIAMITRLDLN